MGSILSNKENERKLQEDIEFIKNEIIAKQPNGNYCKYCKILEAVIVYDLSEQQYVNFWKQQYRNEKHRQRIIEACKEKLYNNTISAKEMIDLISKSTDYETEKRNAIKLLKGVNVEMIFKIQKPLFSSTQESLYLIYNKDRTIMSNDLEVGQIPEIDNLFSKNESKIYVSGYIDKKGRMIINKKVNEQDW